MWPYSAPPELWIECCQDYLCKWKPKPTAQYCPAHLGVIGEEAGVLVVEEVREEVLEERLELRDSGTRGQVWWRYT